MGFSRLRCSIDGAGGSLSLNPPHIREPTGNFARLLGKYVREEKVISLSEAVRRLSGLPRQTSDLIVGAFLEPECLLTWLYLTPQRSRTAPTFEDPQPVFSRREARYSSMASRCSRMVSTLARNQGERYGGPVKLNSTDFESVFTRQRLLENRQGPNYE
jgi:hypothetical protein